VATCFSGIESSESWLIDSGCTNHMTHDKDLFRELRSSNTSKVRIGNGESIHNYGRKGNNCNCNFNLFRYKVHF
jgi:hypothetical protein